MARAMSDQELQHRIDKLPKQLTPERDLWAGIERAMHEKVHTKRHQAKVFVPSAWAASLMVAVFVTWLSFTPSAPTDVTAQQRDNTEAVTQQQSNELVLFMQDNFHQQKQAMLVSFGQPDISQLPAEMQTQLIQLEQARKAIKKALADDSNNVDLLNLLDFTQQQELHLLQQLYSPQLQSI